MDESIRKAQEKYSNSHKGRAKALKYRRSIGGLVTRMYNNMCRSAKLSGKKLVCRAEFREFAMANCQLQGLHREWVESDYCSKLTPTLERIDPYDGYICCNIWFVTKSEAARNKFT